MARNMKPGENYVPCVPNKHSISGSNTLQPQRALQILQFVWPVNIIYRSNLKIPFAQIASDDGLNFLWYFVFHFEFILPDQQKRTRYHDWWRNDI